MTVNIPNRALEAAERTVILLIVGVVVGVLIGQGFLIHEDLLRIASALEARP